MNAYLDLLRGNRNYRNLWLATLVSYAGDWFNLLASAALIARLTNSGTALSLIFVARFVPLFLFSPLGGILADRYSRRRLLMATDLLRAVVVLGFLLVRSADLVWLFYGLTVVQFAISALFTPARNAIVPNIVSDEELVTANALDGFTWSTMLAVGALLGGLATKFLGVETAFVLDAATFLVSAWFVQRLALPPRAERVNPRASGGWLEFVDGLRFLRVRPVILGVALAKTIGTLAWGGVNVLEIELARKGLPPWRRRHVEPHANLSGRGPGHGLWAAGGACADRRRTAAVAVGDCARLWALEPGDWLAGRCAHAGLAHRRHADSHPGQPARSGSFPAPCSSASPPTTSAGTSLPLSSPCSRWRRRSPRSGPASRVTISTGPLRRRSSASRRWPCS